MIVKIDKQRVEVLDAKCRERDCLRVGMDHGPYVQGRGYTSSSYKSRPVCLRRHLDGCPHPSVCPVCRTCSVEAPGARCMWGTCVGVTIAREDA